MRGASSVRYTIDRDRSSWWDRLRGTDKGEIEQGGGHSGVEEVA